MQGDGSFHFHGPILYAGGYGGDYALQISTMAKLASGTAFEPPAASDTVRATFDTYLLDGQQHFVVGPPGPGTAYYDLSTKGREFTRAPFGNLRFPAHVYSSLLNCSYFVGPASPRRSEYAAFVARLSPGGAAAPPLVSSRHFYLSDYTTHHRERFAVTLKMSSTRMENNEVCNNEGLKSWYTGDGVLLPYSTGAEYEGIFPVWDWTALPGTTSRLGVSGTSAKVKHFGRTAFVGGATEQGLDRPFTAAAMDFVSANSGGVDEATTELVASKAWFFVEGGVVAMAVGIALHNQTGQRVITTLDQRLLEAGQPISYSTGAGRPPTPLPSGNNTLSLTNGGWVHHAEKLYLVPFGAPAPAPAVSLMARGGPQSGSWSEINAESGPTATVTKDVFFAAVDHGAAPTLKATALVYAIVPDVLAADAPAAALTFATAVQVIANTKTVQAVLYTPAVGAVATAVVKAVVLAVVRPVVPSAAVIEAPQLGLTLTLSAPSIVVVREDVDGGFAFTASVPQAAKSGSGSIKEAAQPTALTLTLNRRVAVSESSGQPKGAGPSGVACNWDANKKVTVVKFTLPTGPAAGSSITGSCTNPPPSPSPPPPPPPPPVPPLPPPKYKVELVEHNALPALSDGNPAGQGSSPCSNTFNPSYIEVAGKNKVGGILVRTDNCAETNGRLSFAPCTASRNARRAMPLSLLRPHIFAPDSPRITFHRTPREITGLTFAPPASTLSCSCLQHPASRSPATKKATSLQGCAVILSPVTRSTWRRGRKTRASSSTNTTSSSTCSRTGRPLTATPAPARARRGRARFCSPGPRPRRSLARGPMCPAGPTPGTVTAAAGSSRRARRRTASLASPGARGRAPGSGLPTPPTSPRDSSRR